MLEGKNNTFSLPWEIRSIFMQNCFIVSALQHGRRENRLYTRIKLVWSKLISQTSEPHDETEQQNNKTGNKLRQTYEAGGATMCLSALSNVQLATN